MVQAIQPHVKDTVNTDQRMGFEVRNALDEWNEYQSNSCKETHSLSGPTEVGSGNSVPSSFLGFITSIILSAFILYLPYN
jgi:hypothetical protein